MSEHDIFQAAIEISDPTERRAYLDQACGEDTKLREQIESQIAAHMTAPTLRFETPSNGLSVSPADSGQADEPDLSFLQPPVQPGSIGTLGHYAIIKLLGSGAFGIVFKAFDEKLHRFVAIKAMAPRLALTSPPRKRFLREARSAAAIKHENIVQVYSVEETPIPYLVMEYIEGQTLQEKLDISGPLELVELLYLGRQIALGLSAAHSQGLVHRDIKPGNILIESGVEQRVKITDFGLARATDDASMTQTGVISGTPLYMAPEQALGDTLDHRADLFSFASVLYHMASGRPPFRAASTIAVLRRVAEDSPRPLQDIIPEIPTWLSLFISKLHAKNPNDRYQSTKEVADLLGKCLAHVQSPDKDPIPPSLIEIRGTTSQASPPDSNSTRSNTRSQLRSSRVRWAIAIASVAAIYIAAFVIYLNQFQSTNLQEDPKTISSSKVDDQTSAPDPSIPSDQRKQNDAPIQKVLFSPEYKWSEPENLGADINTPLRELNPSLTDDELLMVFARQSVFYQASRESRNEPFSNVRRLEGDFLENPSFESYCSMSGDGLLLVFSSGILGERIEDIFIASRKDRSEPFGKPVRLEEPVNSSGYERHPILSSDGLKLGVTVSRPNVRVGAALIFERLSREEPFGQLNLDPICNQVGIP